MSKQQQKTLAFQKEQQKTLASQKKRTPWWVRFSRILWRLVTFLAFTVVLALIINVISTWLTSSRGSIPSDSPLGIAMIHWPITALVAFCLFLAAVFLWVASRKHTGVVPQSLLPAQDDRARMLRRLRFLLWRKGSIPWQFRMFLDEAARCFLLRRIGGGYSFIHTQVRDYVASLDGLPEEQLLQTRADA